MTYNILTDRLPSTIAVDGRRYSINADFRTGIRLESLIQGLTPELEKDDTKSQKFILDVFQLFFGEDRRRWPRNLSAALDGLMWFYGLGDILGQRCALEKSQGIRDGRIYDYAIDAPYIYAAFRQAYGISLQQVDFMHWWEFHALFRAFPDECKMRQIMDIRAKDLSKIKDPKERSEWAAIKAQWELPVMLTHEQKAARAGALFAKGITQERT